MSDFAVTVQRMWDQKQEEEKGSFGNIKRRQKDQKTQQQWPK